MNNYYEYDNTNNYTEQGPDTGAPCVDFSDVVGLAPSTTTGGVGPSRSDTWMSFDDNIRSVSDCNTTPWLGPSSKVPNSGAIIENYYVNETDRGTVAPENVEQINANRQTAGSTFVTWTDPLRVTTKETGEFAYAANPNREKMAVKQNLWEDKPKNTMKQTTERSYVMNPSKEGSGTTFWSFSDTLKTTTRETTEYAHVGGVAPATKRQDTSRFQFTGPEDQYIEEETPDNETKQENFTTLKKQRSAKTGGARTYAIRGATLITDYFPGAGRTNILQDPDQAYGKIDFKQKNDINMTGPNSYLQSIPDASRMQNNQILAVPRPSSNRIFGMDDRQIASYQVEQLKANPLSPFTNNAGGIIPPLMSYNEPNTYAGMVPDSPDNFIKLLDSQGSPQGGSGDLYPVSIYPLGNNTNTPDTKNPVMNIINGLGYNNKWNPMLEQGSSRAPKEPVFSGNAYSGTFQNNTNTVNGSNIYGQASTYLPIEEGMLGMENEWMQGMYCSGNDALSYATTDYTINRNLY